MLSRSEVKIVLEAALLAAQEPLPISELRKMFGEEIGADMIRRLLEELREAWKDRGVELAATASGWRFQTRASYQRFLERIHPEKAPRSEEHTSELQSPYDLVCRLLLEKKNDANPPPELRIKPDAQK